MEDFLYSIVNKMSPDLGGYIIVVFALGWWILRLDKRYVEAQNDLVTTVKEAYFNKGRKRIGEIDGWTVHICSMGINEKYRGEVCSVPVGIQEHVRVFLTMHLLLKMKPPRKRPTASLRTHTTPPASTSRKSPSGFCLAAWLHTGPCRPRRSLCRCRCSPSDRTRSAPC